MWRLSVVEGYFLNSLYLRINYGGVGALVGSSHDSVIVISIINTYNVNVFLYFKISLNLWNSLHLGLDKRIINSIYLNRISYYSFTSYSLHCFYLLFRHESYHLARTFFDYSPLLHKAIINFLNDRGHSHPCLVVAIFQHVQ